MMRKFLNILITSLILASCTTNEKIADSKEKPFRSVTAANKCEDLFKPKIQLHVIDNDLSKKEKKAVHEATLELMTEVLPKSINDTFWKVIEQMSRNEDTKIKLDSNKMVLTKRINANLNLHSTYMYEPNTNVFVLRKIEYTEKNRDTQLLTSEPLNKQSGKINEDLSLQISELAAGNQDRTIGVLAHIPHSIYKKIQNEMKNLDLFTTHELLKISQLSPKNRMAKYQFMIAGRKIRNFIVRDFMEELIKKPIKTIVISVASITILSHTDFIKNIVSIKQETPEWVAPSVVKMAGRYPDSTQAEIVHLMKAINNSEKQTVKILEKDFEAKNKLVNIDDVDQFTIQADPVNNKTYFVMSHENQNGRMDIYSVEIDPSQYPQLSKQVQVASAEAHPGESK
jgi:hypothetical protein